MFDASTQYDIDEKNPNKHALIDDQNESSRQGFPTNSKSNEAVFLVEILKEQNNEDDRSVGNLTEAVFEEGHRSLSGVSDFNDMDCGEPARGQHLKINFGITEEDNLEMEKKCRSFWKFIESYPHLQKIKVMPMRKIQSTPADSAFMNAAADGAMNSAMQWLDNRDLVKSSMKTKFRTTYCHLERGDYCDGSTKTRNKDAEKLKVSGHKDKTVSVSRRVSSGEDLKTMCKCMDEWDAAHPRSMDPPGHKTVGDFLK